MVLDNVGKYYNWGFFLMYFVFLVLSGWNMGINVKGVKFYYCFYFILIKFGVLINIMSGN